MNNGWINATLHKQFHVKFITSLLNINSLLENLLEISLGPSPLIDFMFVFGPILLVERGNLNGVTIIYNIQITGRNSEEIQSTD